MNRALKTVYTSLMALTIAGTSLPADAHDWNRGGRGGYYHRHGDGDGAAIAVGVGILALGLAAAAASSSHDSGRHVYNDGYYDGPPPPPRPYYDSPYRQSRYEDDNCLQSREYQTTIMIDGRRERAYGTACLQPDGSWQEGPAQLER